MREFVNFMDNSFGQLIICIIIVMVLYIMSENDVFKIKSNDNDDTGF